ncbi:unnamed protein product [Discosporangium mesarthrocarpum]
MSHKSCRRIGGCLHNLHNSRVADGGRDLRLLNCRGMEGARDANLTRLRALHLGVDGSATKEVIETPPVLDKVKAPVEVPVKNNGPKGWGYWGYRAILVLVAAIWGTNFPVLKVIESHTEISSATAAFTRFTIAFLSLLPLADWGDAEVLLAGMEVGLYVSAGYYTQAIGLMTTDASVCAFLCSLTVVFVPLIQAVSGRGMSLLSAGAAGLALIGTGLLELGGKGPSLNDLWCVAQAMGFAMAFTRIEHYMEKFPGKSMQLSIGQLLSVAILSCVWCLTSNGGHIPDFSFLKDRTIAAALGYTGLITTSLAVWMETVALEAVPATEMSVIFSTEPLWATIVSQVFLKETLGPNALLGAAFIFSACLTAQAPQVISMFGTGKEGSEEEEGASRGLSEMADGQQQHLPETEE